MKTGAELIAEERDRQQRDIQMGGEGFSKEFDTNYSMYELSQAATCYSMFSSCSPQMREHIRVHTMMIGEAPAMWPKTWNKSWWKPGVSDGNESRIREMVKAGALLAAQIDALQEQSHGRDLRDDA